MKINTIRSLIEIINVLESYEPYEGLFTPQIVERLVDLDEEEIKEALNTPSDNIRVAKIYMLAVKDEMAPALAKVITQAIEAGNEHIFRVLRIIKNKDIRKREDIAGIVELVLKTDDRKSDAITNLAERKEFLDRPDSLEFLNILANAEEDYQLYNPINIMTDEESLKNKDVLEMVKAVVNAKCALPSIMATHTAKNPLISKRNDALEFVKTIASAKGSEFKYGGQIQAQCAYDVAVNQSILQHEKALEMVRVIANAEYEYQAKLASIVAQNPYVYIRENALEFVWTASVASEEAANALISAINETDLLTKYNALDFISILVGAEDFQTRYIGDVINNQHIMNYDNTIEFLMTLSNAEEEYQIENASTVAINLAKLEQPASLTLEMTKAVATAKGDTQALSAKYLALEPAIIKHKKGPEIVKIIAEAEEINQTLFARALALEPNILSLDNSLEIIESVANAKTSGQAFYRSEMAKKTAELEKTEALAKANKQTNDTQGDITIQRLIQTGQFEKLADSLVEIPDHNQDISKDIKVFVKA